MKARPIPAALPETSKNPKAGLETTQHRKMLKMKVDPDELLKTKGQEK
jgi:hypothetical protein